MLSLLTIQSQERARKLRAYLAVEEHCGHELGRILKEIAPGPKISEARKSRPRRKVRSIWLMVALLYILCLLQLLLPICVLIMISLSLLIFAHVVVGKHRTS